MKIGFIGLGNMAGAILGGMLQSGKFEGDTLIGIDRSPEVTKQLAQKIGIAHADDTAAMVADSDVVVLAVKPQQLDAVMPVVRENLRRDALLVTIAAGRSIGYYEAAAPGAAVVRVMPNINALAGAATAALCANAQVSDAQKKVARDIFETMGTVEELAEELFPIFTAIAACSPAYTYLYIDELARAAVKHGMPRAQALSVAASAVFGSARMVMEHLDVHPAELADRVCSPGGSTIEGVLTLRALGFESAVHAAVDATVEKDRRMG